MKFSIVIPIYNCQMYLHTSINGVLKQTYQNWEMILVDDGSSDESGNISDYYADKFENIFVDHINNAGPSNARNVGLKRSRGDYCIFIDSDDILDENALQKIYDVVCQKQYDLLMFGYTQVKFNTGNLHKIREARTENISFNSNHEFSSEYIKFEDIGYTHPVWNKAYRRELLLNNSIFFPIGINISEDFIFNLNVYKSLKTAYAISDILYYYISYDTGTITSTFNIKKLDNIFSVFEKSSRLMKEWQPKYLYLVNTELIRNISVFINSLFNDEVQLSYGEKRNLVKKIMSKTDKYVVLKKIITVSFRDKVICRLIRLRQVDLLLLSGKISRSIK